jgi:hypothetical protein
MVAAIAACLSGCDMGLVSSSMPGLAPGFGVPLRGRVIDSRTGLGVGGATVMGGLGRIGSAPDGSFEVYWDLAAGRELSFARAGYVSATYISEVSQSGGTFAIAPTSYSNGTMPNREVAIGGVLRNRDGSPLTALGSVSFGTLGDTPANTQDGSYALVETTGSAGAVTSGILAGGQVVGGPVAPGNSPQAFQYASFGMRNIDIPLGNPGGGRVATADLTVQDLPFPEVSIALQQLAAFQAPAPRVDVRMDFGMLGTVRVARSLSSSTTLRIPSVSGARLVVEASIQESGGRSVSRASLTTDYPSTVLSLPMLPSVRPKAPKDGARGVGGSPLFEWDPVKADRAVQYQVEVFEDAGGGSLQPRWRGTTSRTSIAYPGFFDWDANGGALYPQASYSWSVRAYYADSQVGTSTLGTSDLQPSSRVFRGRAFESVTSGMRFSR